MPFLIKGISFYIPTEYRLTMMLNGGVQSNLTFETSGNIRYDGTIGTKTYVNGQ